MPNITSELLQFLMNLFGDRQAAQEFLDNPEEALENAGLGDVCSADLDAVMPVVLDFAPIAVKSSFDREFNTGGNSSLAGTGAAAAPGHHAPAPQHEDHAHAVQQLHHVVNNYSYTSTTDDRDTITDQSVNQNIWADGDVTQLFDNDAVVASGDGAIAAGDDVEVDESEDNSTNITVGDIEDSFNEDNDTRIDVDIEDSFNEDNSVEDSYNEDNDGIDGDENVVGDGNAAGDIVGGDQVDGDQIDVGDVTVGDIAGGDQIDVDLENVGNTDESVTVGDLENVGNTDESLTVGDIDASVTDESLTIGDIDASVTDESLTIGDIDASVTEDNDTFTDDRDLIDAEVPVDGDIIIPVTVEVVP
jgi:hypothetical protein